MRQKTFLQISALIFLAVSIMHLLRLLNGWEIKIHNCVIPMWASWVALPVALFLSYTAMKFIGKK